MLAATPYIYDMFANIVLDVQSKAGISVHYEHGHPLEIVKTLSGMAKTPDFDRVKYPAIFLFHPFTEKKSEEIHIESDVTFNIVIVHLTDPNMVASQRLTCNFKPILYPLYDLFMYSLTHSGYFILNPNKAVKHDKIDQMYWGKKGLYGSESNIFNDYLDAIEISNLTLSLKKYHCI